jgi:hypothetical protein
VGIGDRGLGIGDRAVSHHLFPIPNPRSPIPLDNGDIHDDLSRSRGDDTGAA